MAQRVFHALVETRTLTKSTLQSFKRCMLVEVNFSSFNGGVTDEWLDIIKNQAVHSAPPSAPTNI